MTERSSPVKYGTYRETYDPQSDRLNLVNLICVPSAREFEWMIAHSAGALLDQEAKQQRLAALERKKTQRHLVQKEETKEKRVDSAEPITSKDNDGSQPGEEP